MHKNSYEENYKIIKFIEGHNKKIWISEEILWMNRLNIIKITTLSKLTNKLNVIPVKIPTVLLCENWHTDLKIHMGE